jgi:hypothetical protein
VLATPQKDSAVKALSKRNAADQHRSRFACVSGRDAKAEAAALSPCPWTRPDRPEACRQRKAARPGSLLAVPFDGHGTRAKAIERGCVWFFLFPLWKEEKAGRKA